MSIQTVAKFAKRLQLSPNFNVRPQVALTQIDAPSRSISHDRSHIAAVHEKLASSGLLKVRLGFPDDQSQYLKQLILGLHKYHRHGLPIDHSSSRGWFWDVRPTPEDQFRIASSGQNAKLSFQARSETMMSFPWHTDCSYESSPPRFFGLHVLQPDRCNGGVLSILAVQGLVKALSSTAKEILSKPNFRIAVPPEFVKNENEKYITGSLLDGGSPGQQFGESSRLRFREDIVSPLTPEATAALAEFKDVLQGPEIQDEIIHLTPDDLPRGSVVLIDNRRWLHARNEVKDPERHLRRVRWDAIPFTSGSN